MLCDSCKKECEHSVHHVEERTPSSTSSSSPSREAGEPDNRQKNKKAKRKRSNVTFALPVEEEPQVTFPPAQISSDVQQQVEAPAPLTRARSSSWTEPAYREVPTISESVVPGGPNIADPTLKPAKSPPALNAPADLHRVVSPGTAPPVIPLSPVITPEVHDDDDDDSSQNSAKEKLKRQRERSKSRVGTVSRSFLTVFWKPRRRKQGRSAR